MPMSLDWMSGNLLRGCGDSDSQVFATGLTLAVNAHRPAIGEQSRPCETLRRTQAGDSPLFSNRRPIFKHKKPTLRWVIVWLDR